MVTRTFQKITFVVKAISEDDTIKTFETIFWEFEIPNGKRAQADLFSELCNERGLEYFKHSVAHTDTEVRGIDERTFFDNSIHVDR